MNSQPIDLDQEENSEEEEPEGAPVVSTTTRDLNVDEETSSQGKASGSGKWKRVLKSKWWQYFEMLPKIEGEDLRCKCKACGITYKAESSMGIGLKRIDSFVDKIRLCVKYVKGSQVRKQKFIESVTQTSLDSKKSLRQDVPTRWNSTYLMLSSAMYYRRAFNHLRLDDTNFTHCPSVDEWGQVEKIYKFLEVFYETTTLFSGLKYPTANLYFPRIFMVQLTISQAMQSSDDFMRSMANRMFHKFDKYWKDYNILFAIAMIVDPRFKMQFVEFCYNKLYGHGSNELSLVRSKLVSLFEEYMHMSIASKVSTSSASLSSHSAIDDNASLALNLGSGCMDVLKEFDTFQSLEFIGRAQKSQLELYLEEPTIDRITKLDVLGFWKAHQFRYPDLAQMARDILSVPISTVASESTFSTSGRILDQYRSVMKPDVVEALVCCRDWLAGGKECVLKDGDLLDPWNFPSQSIETREYKFRKLVGFDGFDYANEIHADKVWFWIPSDEL
ncbi:hypothetical protein ZIOFF_022314 [Zingiber officinale]|uniref:Transposase n=1 Tax=Zingiber officinale TaxID=94328 RepID=A0A8J5H2P7_ZINOF|nr:hypothetical protein ZIOFF_022314 [Zingiber officinale]